MTDTEDCAGDCIPFDLQFHDATGEAEQWARDEDYLYTDCCGWVDAEDNPVDVETLFEQSPEYVN